MPNKFLVAIDGKAQVFTSKRSYLKWATSTKDGLKYLMWLPALALVG